ncbi:hypothetical protein [Bradyrhizobium sp.]|uniref:hypothetical protein n=1 Tax=Bradyrhizobium sp. TaxID=376 RepID=UPI003C3CCAEB
MSKNSMRDHGRRLVNDALADAIVSDGRMIDDAALVVLGQQFEALTANIRAVEQNYVSLVAEKADGDPEAEAAQLIEALSHRLSSVEKAILGAPAPGLVGLGVKARLAAVAVSDYWSRPLDNLPREARAVRCLIEDVCRAAGLALHAAEPPGTA